MLAMIAFLGTSCLNSKNTEPISNLGDEWDPELEIVLEDIRQNWAVERVTYKLLGNPDLDTQRKGGSAIMLELINSDSFGKDLEATGREIAKKVYTASSETSRYKYVTVAFVSDVDEGIIKYNSTRNKIYETASLR